MSAFSVENPHDGKMFENYTRFEWGVEVGVVTIFVLRLIVPREFDMPNLEKTSRHFLLGSLYQHFLTSLSLPAGPRKTLQKLPFWLTVLALADADLFSLV